MEENHDQIKALFIRLTEGKSTPAERLQLLEYLRHNPQAEAVPEVEELQRDNWPLMPEWAAEAVMASILQKAPAARVLPLWKRTWVKVAAVVLPIIGIAALAMMHYGKGEAFQHYVNTGKSVQTILLADGTSVSLNQRARLSVSTAGGREVWLEGEAFFSVQQQAAAPFVVHTANALDVTVLGTAFNVNARKTNTQVVLNAGRVKVGAGGENILLRPGEMADYNAATGKLTKQPADTLLHTSWKYDLIAFKAQPMEAVMDTLEKQYGIEVVFDRPEAAALLFTGYLASNDLPQAINTLEEAFTLKITLHNNQLHVNIK